jgi:hypothetical protein
MKVFILSLGLLLAACGSGRSENNQAKGNGKGANSGSHGELGNPREVLASYPTFELTDAQKYDLRYMWQEEKLARDVYLHLFDLWGSRIFSNISSSEQKHMDAISAILEKYNIDQEIDGGDRGVFSIVELQTLFNHLIEKGSENERAAFGVGREIEELDIEDLKSRINTAHPDAKEVYENLLNGSYNHLTAFNRQLN